MRRHQPCDPRDGWAGNAILIPTSDFFPRRRRSPSGLGSFWFLADNPALASLRSHAPGDGMVRVPGGEFWMGMEHPQMADARPVHRVHVDGFWMDKTEVTNAQFAAFVEKTEYVTVAEK